MGCSIGKADVLKSVVRFVFRIFGRNIFSRSPKNINQGPWMTLNGDAGKTVTINWTTNKRRVSCIKWGEARGLLSNILYTEKNIFHSITINKLRPGCKYYYSIEEEFESFDNEHVFSFRTIPEIKEGETLKIVIAGDMQPNDKYTLKTCGIISKQIQKENPDFVIQVGDLVHVGGLKREWNNTKSIIPILASERPILSVIGNHEYYPFFNNKTYRKYFPYDYPDEKGCYYSVDIGPLHISFIDSYDNGFNGMDSNISSMQRDWLEKDLSDAVTRNCAWIIVVLHQPVFTTGEYPNDLELQKWLIPVLSNYDVDIVFYGHSHLYEHWRYKYGANGYLMNKDGKEGDTYIDYFCIGSSGIDLESNYELFSHKPYNCKDYELYNMKMGKYEKVESVHYPWNKRRHIDGYLNKDYFKDSEKHYYHFPFEKKEKYSQDKEVSYNTLNEMYGYLYGENTMHYAVFEVGEEISRLFVRYADGSIINGAEEAGSQEFEFKRKERIVLKSSNRRRAMAHAKIVIACVGDSDTDGWPGELDYTPYTVSLQEKLGDSYSVLNFGKFNTTAAFSMDDPYIKNDVYKRAIESSPDIVTIMLGGNDGKDYNWESHGKEYKRDLGLLVERFQNLETHPEVVLCTLAPIAPDNKYKLNDKLLENEIIPLIREVATEKDLVLIDVFGKLSPINDLSIYDNDKLHLNNKGHKIVADIFYDVLSKEILTKKYGN